MTERISPPYELASRKRDTKDADKNHLGLIRIERTPKQENIEVLRLVAFHFGLRVRMLDDTTEELRQQGRVRVEISPDFGTVLPDWKRFWKTYHEEKKRRAPISQ